MSSREKTPYKNSTYKLLISRVETKLTSVPLDCQFYCNKSISYTISTGDASLLNALSIGIGLVAVIIAGSEHESRFDQYNNFCAYHIICTYMLGTLNITPIHDT